MKTVDLSLIFKDVGKTLKFETYRKYWHKADKYEVLTDFPMHLDVELSGICNLKCDFCFQNGLINKPLGLMELKLFKKIIDEGALKGLCSLKLQIRGESLLHPNIFDCIAYAKDAGILDVQITTNATLLNDDISKKIIESGLDGIVFSVDNQHSESYETRFDNQTYTDIECSIKRFLKIRAKVGNSQSRPWVRLQTSIPQFDAESFRNTKAYITDKFPEADIVVVNRLQVYNDDKDTYPDLHINYELQPCGYLMQRLAIFWNGDVTTCCMDYNNRFNLGNIESQTIQEIWLSERMDEFRALHKKGARRTMPICKHCHACTVCISEENEVDNTPRHYDDLKQLEIT